MQSQASFECVFTITLRSGTKIFQKVVELLKLVRYNIVQVKKH